MAVQIFGTGFIIMVICIACGILLSYAGGMFIDTLTMGRTGETLINNTEIHISTEWRQAQYNSMWWFINLYYFLCYCIPVLGIGIFIQSILPRTTGDRYG
jgi:hypothetical protein